MMNEIELLQRALEIDSQADREDFVRGECRRHDLNPDHILGMLQQIHKTFVGRTAVEEAEQDLSVGSLDAAKGMDHSPSDTEGSAPADTPDASTIDHSASGVAGVSFAERYVLQHKLGEGGMGEVWSAKQTAPIKRKVAIKLIKRGMDSNALLKRFEQERQALALMDHPNIASVFDGGVTASGQSFFVMELVNGLPLTKYADQQKLSTNERMQLFVSICNAVQHAHQKGVVHRDLKPANILVGTVDGKPVPKIIDFGVAKATGGNLTEQSVETQFGAVIGTLEYMAPEQAGYSGIDIDTRADIYSLGVILYELLTGLRPIDHTRLKKAGLAEMIRVIQEEDPARPSTRLSTSDSLESLASVRQIEPRKLTALLRGELDWVVMRCLEKDRDRRYETANGLSKDIQRFLSGQAVEARPTSIGYRLSKVLQRNRGAVVASALVLAALLAGVAGTSWGWSESRKQAEIAELEVETQTEINKFLREDILAQASAFTQSESIFAPDPDLKVKTALDRAAKGIANRFDDRPLVAASLHKTIGIAYSDLGEYSTAQNHLEQAYRVFQELRGPLHPDTYQTQVQLGFVYQQQDKHTEAEQHLGDALMYSRQALGKETRETLNFARLLANCYSAQGTTENPEKLSEARKIFQETSRKMRAMFGPQDVDLSLTLFGLAMNYRAESERTSDEQLFKLAESTMQEAMDASSHLGEENPFRIHLNYVLGLLAADRLDYDQSFEIHEKVVSQCISTFGEFHPITARAMDALGSQYSVRSRMDDAERLFLKSLEVRRKIYGSDHAATDHAVFAIAQHYLNRGAMSKAEPFYRERFNRSRRIKGSRAVDTLLAGRDLAVICTDLGKLDEAEQLLNDSLDGFADHFDDQHPIVALTKSYQADVLVLLGRAEEALPFLEASVQSIRDQEKPHPIELASALAALADCQMQMEEYQASEQSFREAIELFTKYIPQAWPSFVYQSRLGSTLVAQNKLTEAESLLITGYEGVIERRDSCPPPLFQTTVSALVEFYEAAGKTEKAGQLRQEHADILN